RNKHQSRMENFRKSASSDGPRALGFEDCSFVHWNLFRISSFGFRISDCGIAWALISVLFVSCQAPPRERGDFRTADLVELTRLDPNIRLEIRYAGTNNFLGRPVYKQARAFLQRPAAEALVRANEALRPLGYGLLVFDGYRPWAVTRIF